MDPTLPSDSVHVAFYKGPTDTFGSLIRLWTRSRYAHVELWFPSGERCAVSTKTGVTVYSGIGLQHDPSCWDLVEVRYTLTARRNMAAFIRKTNGHAYDWKGIVLSQFLGGRGDDRDRWFCSEHVLAALQQANADAGYTSPTVDKRDPSGVSPGKLYRMLTKKGNSGYRLDQKTVTYGVALIIAAVTLAMALFSNHP